MWFALGVMLLLVGVTYPMAALYWLNRRMGRQPAPTSRQVGLILAFNGLLPVGLILAGVGCLVPRLWAGPQLKAVTGLAVLAALVVLIMLLAARQPSEPAAGDARSPHGG